MHMHHLNLLAILVAAIATMIVGFLWYSPLLFAKPWMREMGCDPEPAERMLGQRPETSPKEKTPPQPIKPESPEKVVPVPGTGAK